LGLGIREEFVSKRYMNISVEATKWTCISFHMKFIEYACNYIKIKCNVENPENNLNISE